ncbi:MAG TPA: hypothetical protein DCK95_00820 [Anaerolineaceae bacterium]|nr:hypothetical protein [Anaerolineaceae bacterium]
MFGSNARSPIFCLPIKKDAYEATINSMFNFNESVSITLEPDKADENALHAQASEIFNAITG